MELHCDAIWVRVDTDPGGRQKQKDTGLCHWLFLRRENLQYGRHRCLERDRVEPVVDGEEIVDGINNCWIAMVKEVVSAKRFEELEIMLSRGTDHRVPSLLSVHDGEWAHR